MAAEIQAYSILCHLAKDVPQSHLRFSSEERKVNRELDEPRASCNIGGANSEESNREAPKACRLRPFRFLSQRKPGAPASLYRKEGNVFIKY